MDEELKGDSSWSWLTQTPVGQVLSLIAVASAPLAFVEERGLAWTTLVVAAGTWTWWYTTVLNAWEPRTLFSPRQKRYSVKQIACRALLPMVASVAFIWLFFGDVNKLNIWRRDFAGEVLAKDEYGRVNKFFGDTAPRTTPADIEEYDRAEWIRWLAAGAEAQADKAALLFIKTEAFSKKYHTFLLEIHDLSKQVRPCRSGAAFLVSDKAGDSWNRRTLRQVPCDFAGDGNTRLFRVLVENPDPGEYLWLFPNVTAAVPNVDFDTLNLQLMVRQ